jgi:acetylornithine/succinyldiaminopimelate/putrescine aminotransferase
MEVSRTINGLRTGGLEASHLLTPNLAAHYPTAIRGEGPYLFDSEGRRHFDKSSGAMTANLDHGQRGIGEVMANRRRLSLFSSEISSAASPQNGWPENSASFGESLFELENLAARM